MPESHLIGRRQILQASAVGIALVAAGPLAGCSDPRDYDRISFLNWQDYIAPDLLDEFTAKSGISVTYETYVSNDELERRLAAAQRPRPGGRTGSSFDLIVPSDNLVTALRDSEQIQKLDLDQIPNIDNLEPAFRETAFDPGNEYSVPWATGTTGLGYDTTKFSEPPTYEVFLDERYKGQMTILDEQHDALGMALLALGFDPNTTDPTEVDEAADLLIEMQAQSRLDSGTYLEGLVSGEIVVAQGYSSDVLQAREQNPDIAYVIPAEGGLRWVDSMVIPDAAPRPDDADKFINFYLQPEVAAANSEYVQVDTGNEAARDLLPQDILDDPVIFPPESVLESLYFTANLGDDEAIYDEAWARVQEAD
ncbi:MAG: Spermidine-binding periplasmic protein SpuE [Acidimicrobiales bacterium]|nr:Spermidine-binding periplasmic protein SpuE [Acidimicrobiales bacterium]